MSVLRPRNRLVYFRLSEDEFQKLDELCQSEGARSISDLTRGALQKLMREGTGSPDAMVLQRLRAIDEIICELHQTLWQLHQFLDERTNGDKTESAAARTVNG